MEGLMIRKMVTMMGSRWQLKRLRITMMEKEGENDNDGHDKQTGEQTWQILLFD